MAFEWDPDKDRLNQEKHGIAFAFACRIFEGPVLTAPDVRRDYGERRDISIGAVEGVVVLVVVHTERGAGTRIISARRANAKERNRYEERLRAEKR